jgi:hypothetical protein
MVAIDHILCGPCANVICSQYGGEWEKDSTYRETDALVLDDSMCTGNQPQEQETAA